MSLQLPHYTKAVTKTRLLVPLFVIISLIGLSLGLLFENPYARLYPFSLLAGTLTFIFLRRNSMQNSITVPSIIPLRITLIVYLLTVTAAIQLYQSAGVERSPIVFVATVLLYLIPMLSIFINNSKKVSLGMIICSGVFQRATAFYSSSLYVGIDIFTHHRFVSGIIAEQTLSGIGQTKYFYAPLYHILIGWSSLLLNMPLRNVTILVVSVTVTAIPAVAAYLIGTHWHSRTIGLVAALLLTGSDFIVQWGIRPTPTSLGIVFFVLVLLTTIEYTELAAGAKKSDPRRLLLCGLFFISLNLTHQFSVFVSVIILIAIFLGTVLFDSRISNQVINISSVAGSILFLNFVITKSGGSSGGRTFFDKMIGGLTLTILETSADERIARSLPKDSNITPVGAAGIGPAHAAGSAALLALGVLGALLMLDRSGRGKDSKVGFVLGVAVSLPLAIALIGPIFGIRNLLPFRWFAFLYFPLSILAAYGLGTVLRWVAGRTFGTQLIRVAGIGILICGPYFLFMSGNFVAAPDGPIFDESPGAQRLSTTDTELALYAHQADYGLEERTTLADVRAIPPLTSLDANAGGLSIRYGQPNTVPGDSYIINRAYLRSKHAQYRIRYQGAIFRVYGSFPVEGIHDRRVSTVYDAGEDRLITVS
jgi:hypothetical protein